MFSNTDRTDVRIANIADNHHAEIRRITVIPTEITVSAYPSRRDDPNPNEPVRSRVPPHGAPAHGARRTGPAGRDKKRAEGTRPGKQTVTPHFRFIRKSHEEFPKKPDRVTFLPHKSCTRSVLTATPRRAILL